MSGTINLEKPLGHVAIFNSAAGTYRSGHLYARVTPATKHKPEQIVGYEMLDPVNPIFIWGGGDTLREAVNSFMTDTLENKRVALIEPNIFNMVVKEITESELKVKD